MRYYLALLAVALVSVAAVQAADQTILGKRFLLKDPQPGVDATQRRIVAQGREVASSNQVVGDPTAAGGTLTVIVSGATSANQVFSLPQGTDPSSGKPFWSSASASSFKYRDPNGANGPVKTLHVKRSTTGTFQIKVVALGKNGPITLAPPNPGASACMRLDLGSGDRYSVVMPPALNSTVSKNDAEAFLLKNALIQGALCEISTSVCGNGIREPGEQCDGGPACTSSCVQNVPNCCASVATCIAAPGFSLLNTLTNYCAFTAPGSTAVPGAICQPDGSCAVEPIGPGPVCCQETGSCFEGTFASTEDLWNFHNLCMGLPRGTTVPTAVCDPGGACVPQ